MRILLDQMIHTKASAKLRMQGHDVEHVADLGLARADDAEILERATQTNRILITLDQHFGHWNILPLNRHPGVIRVRVHPANIDNILQILIPFLNTIQPDDLENCLIILSRNNVRRIRTIES